MDLPNQPPVVQTPAQPSPIVAPPPQKPGNLLTLLSIFFILLVVTSVILFTLKSKLNTTKKTLTLTPTPIITQTVSSLSPTTILKEEYANPFAPTGTTNKQYSNPFEQTNNPFDELAK